MVEQDSEKTDQPVETNQTEMMEAMTADKEAIRAAEEDAHATLPAPIRVGGQAIHGIKKVYYKLLAGRLSQLQQQLIDQDHELSEIAHDVGQLTAEVIQMNRLLRGIDERLARLEERSLSDGSDKVPD